MDRHEMAWNASHHGPGPLTWVLLILFLVGVVAFAVIAVRWLLGERAARNAVPVSPPAGGAEDALQVARLRYARGEVDREEFLRLWEDLAGPAPPTPPPGPITAG